MQLLDKFTRCFNELVFSRASSRQPLQISARLSDLLLDLNATADALADALDAEEESGEKAFAASVTESPAALARWQQCREQVERMQEAYYQAVTVYREHVASLPRSQRTRATELGRRAMYVRPVSEARC